MMAMLRNGCLWTCHHVGLGGTNGSYAGGPAGDDVDRSAVQWLKLRVNSEATALDYDAHGRVFDRTALDPCCYYFPSLAVNCAGDMVAGFSGSSASSHIGAFAAWRLSNGFSPAEPVCLQPGSDAFGEERWGDYSATLVDPTEGWSFWTVQEYADSFWGDRNWATWISKIRPIP